MEEHMKKKFLVAKEKIADSILNVGRNKNSVRVRKPISRLSHIIVLFILVLVSFFVLYKIDSFDDKKISFLGNIFTIVVSFVIMYITINNEKRKDYLLARKNAYTLSEIIKSVNYQIENINRGHLNIISYPASWIDYYNQCSVYLKYSYIDELMLEFSTVENINRCVAQNDIDTIKNLINNRNYHFTDSQSDFNILNIGYNLSLFAGNQKESKSWKEEKRYIDFDVFVRENYKGKIKELTIKYLKQKNGTCNENEVENFIMNELKKDEKLSKGEYKFIAMENKAMRRAIFKIYLSLSEEDEFSLCWGELTLKK